MEQILLAYGLLKETVVAITILYRNHIYIYIYICVCVCVSLCVCVCVCVCLCVFKQDYIYLGGARGIIAVIVGNGYDDKSSNFGRD